jgi:4-diphosphocytidyl-2-C-methyl-D-erythritol kinase
LFSLRAYAKINLGLLVTEKRPDGYHNIETVFHRVNLFDEITLEAAPAIVVQSPSSDAPAGERNICHKAAALLKQHLGCDRGVGISISKNIPVGAGLGGGSSDAATVLKHLPDFWGRTVSKDALWKLALQLGSDVPYFLGDGSAFARGRGEVLEYFQLDMPYTILLCNPGIHVSTAWAYQHVTPQNRSIDLKAAVVSGMHHLPDLSAALVNDLEPAVFRKYPAIRQVKELMLQSGTVASSMSGSGSSVYGLFDDEGKATDASRSLAGKGFKVHLTPPHFSPSER